MVQQRLLRLIVGKCGHQRRVEKWAVRLVWCRSHVRGHGKWGGAKMRSGHCVQTACSVDFALGRKR